MYRFDPIAWGRSRHAHRANIAASAGSIRRSIAIEIFRAPSAMSCSSNLRRSMAMSSGKLAPTPQQTAAITSSGKSLLVSAAAGSGKTSVLAQRCVHLICDAKPKCNVGQLLVVTFTEAAALEMKARIETALRERLARESHNAHLVRQLSLID